ncbi:alkaline phosphatase PhoX [Nonomuraea roseoviolacea]|uniref:Secreted PhoX family phosphatase n=1 Tax=Nonomuraea roseoviolacea subsp. carminata TaxID=160689 RepID=A0ABT1JWP5_9ACTN|nr:alkaline phosphatase PhoX [Nonomuraea roseoviolacea]MCP2346187.1 secreted PhoX family phosphatase [Nonomuraea roseoviolacea subsp. carminata]
MDRRRFLARAAVAAAAGIAGPFAGVACAAERGAFTQVKGYGPMKPVRDKRDGEVRLHLPDGFAYRSFNEAGSTFPDGSTVPGRHDGMAAFAGPRDTAYLVRNHEVGGPVGAFGDKDKAYDPMAGGGTVTLQVTRHGEVLKAAPSLNGTMLNCSGGPMPWKAWVSCEETVNGPDVGDDHTGGDNSKLTRRHGYIFEVPVTGAATARPIRSAGRFAHESAAFDPESGALYLTEDCFGFPSGLYRYLPPEHPLKAGRLLDGGKLQMLAVKGSPREDLSAGQRHGATYATTWVDIDEPDPTFTGRPSNDEAVQAVGRQGRAKGAAIFSRLEGAIHHQGTVYFVSTQGGATAPGDTAPSGFGKGRGQVWAYETWSGRLRLVYESPRSTVLDLPDNVTASPRGTLVLCEDGDGDNFLRGLTRHGELFDFCRMEPVAGDPGAEFAGSTFGPGGHTLYVNVQSTHGMSFAIWGPWQRGAF